MRAPEHSALGGLHSGVSPTRMAWAHRPMRTYPLTATRESVEPMGLAESPAGAQQATRKRVSVHARAVCTQVCAQAGPGCSGTPPPSSL